MNMIDATIRCQMAKRIAAEEAVLRNLLGKWVSEIEPQVFRRQGSGAIIGIGAVGSLEPEIEAP